jgi:hypothetical protein
MDPDAAREGLEQFLLREFPDAVPLSRYQPFALPVVVSFELDDDLDQPPCEVLHITAERAAQVFELAFGPQDRGWVCAVLHGALQAVLQEPLELEDVTEDGRIDLDAFVPQPVRPPAVEELDVLLDALPPAARELVSIRHGHDPLTSPEFEGLTPEEGVPHVDVVVRVRPRDVDYRSLIRAVVNQDFPMEGRRRLRAWLYFVNEDRPALFDLPDDRYCGVAMPDVEALRPVYESGLAPLNSYRRPEMEAVFGSWPEPP